MNKMKLHLGHLMSGWHLPGTPGFPENRLKVSWTYRKKKEEEVHPLDNPEDAITHMAVPGACFKCTTRNNNI